MRIPAPTGDETRDERIADLTSYGLSTREASIRADEEICRAAVRNAIMLCNARPSEAGYDAVNRAYAALQAALAASRKLGK